MSLLMKHFTNPSRYLIHNTKTSNAPPRLLDLARVSSSRGGYNQTIVAALIVSRLPSRPLTRAQKHTKRSDNGARWEKTRGHERTVFSVASSSLDESVDGALYSNAFHHIYPGHMTHSFHNSHLRYMQILVSNSFSLWSNFQISSDRSVISLLS